MLLLKRCVRSVDDDTINLVYNMIDISLERGSIEFNIDNLISILQLNNVEINIEELQEMISNISSELLYSKADMQLIIYLKQLFEDALNKKLYSYNLGIRLKLKNTHPNYCLYY